ncbi:MAG: hypothetical protein JAY84_02510 [Candidatus Thiodiazotropha taylori]|nr:hypothetical protein [Candidatus Thiodiazotropha taylori]
MNRTKKDAWLAGEIESARRSYDSLPSWVKETARFEGTNHHSLGSYNNASNKSENRHRQSKK